MQPQRRPSAEQRRPLSRCTIASSSFSPSAPGRVRVRVRVRVRARVRARVRVRVRVRGRARGRARVRAGSSGVFPSAPLPKRGSTRSPYISLHLPTSPYISLHLPTSPYTSLHLPTSQARRCRRAGIGRHREIHGDVGRYRERSVAEELVASQRHGARALGAHLERHLLLAQALGSHQRLPPRDGLRGQGEGWG